jgi:hypothetical protein
MLWAKGESWYAVEFIFMVFVCVATGIALGRGQHPPVGGSELESETSRGKSVCKWRVLATPPSDSDSSNGFLIRGGLSRTAGVNYQQADIASAQR